MEKEKLAVVLKHKNVYNEANGFIEKTNETSIVGVFEESEAWDLAKKLNHAGARQFDIEYQALQLTEKDKVFDVKDLINLHIVCPEKYS